MAETPKDPRPPVVSLAEGDSGHGKGQPSPPAGDTSLLSQSNRDLLALSQELFREFNPQPGAVSDLPQVTIDSPHVAKACRLAKEEPRLGFHRLLCLACVDYREYLQLVYILHSINQEHSLVIKTNVESANPRVPSVTSIWRAADWYEREAHDLFGVAFDGHSDLAPLLLYEGFEGFPGRKEFPFHDYQEF